MAALMPSAERAASSVCMQVRTELTEQQSAAVELQVTWPPITSNDCLRWPSTAFHGLPQPWLPMIASDGLRSPMASDCLRVPPSSLNTPQQTPLNKHPSTNTPHSRSQVHARRLTAQREVMARRGAYLAAVLIQVKPSTALHSPPQPSTALHSPPQPPMAFHSLPWPSTALHSLPALAH